MQFLDLVTLASKNIWRAGTRTGLCVLAICIGITSVSTVLGLGAAAGERVSKELDRIGISGVAFYTKSGEAFAEEAVSLITQTNGIKAVMPIILSTGTVTLRNVHSNAGILGVDEALDQVFQLEILHGSLPNAQQIRAAAKVVVIEDTFAQATYRRTNVIGKSVYITMNGVSEKMEICGVIRSQSASFASITGAKMPYLIYLPHTTLQTMDADSGTDKLIVSMDDEQPELEHRILTQLNRLFDDQYLCENLNQYVDSITGITEIVSLLISGIAAISVVVGGIGVMNSMVSAVDTRTREIGIYRALGARKRDIIGNYLCEAMLLCFTGGLYGILLNGILFAILRRISGLTLRFQLQSAAISLGVAILCGVLFGLLPAIRAARLDPIDAIRTE